MADKEKKEGSVSTFGNLGEANQALVESISAAQERNLKYAQSVFESTMELLKGHVESTRALLEEWEHQAKTRQEASGTTGTGGTYLEDLFRVPLTAYQQTLKVIESASRQSIESFQKATESIQQAMDRGQEQWKEVAQQVQHSTGKPKE